MAAIPDSVSPRVAIIGGGFSGAMALVNLVRGAEAPLSIALIEPCGEIGRGAAYSTENPAHLLNVRADKMGALAEAEHDFHAWLQTPEGRAKHATCRPACEARPDDFMPRLLYRRYLQHRVREARALAEKKNIRIGLHATQAADAELHGSALRLRLENGASLTVDALVLATGNLPAQKFPFEAALADHPRYVADVWNPAPGGVFPHRLSELPPDGECFIVGTGLTMVDAVLSLENLGYRGRITALSRRGLMPLPHRPAPLPPYPAWPLTASGSVPVTALGLLHALRAEIRRAAAQGADWRSVVDSLRPVTPRLWRNLPPHEQKRFLQRLLTYWNVHRHRVAPDAYAPLQRLQEAGRLRVLSGSLRGIGAHAGALQATFRRRRAAETETLPITLALNCSGPGYDVAASGNPLLCALQRRGMITENALRFGINPASDGSAAGNVPGLIFPIGPLLAGEYLESTAVPELRGQAARTAELVLARLRAIKGA